MNSIGLDFKAAHNLLTPASSVVMASHEFTDPDDLGAMLGLKDALTQMGKKVSIVARGGMPENLIFMPGATELVDTPPTHEYDTVIFLGCGDIARHGFKNWDLSNKKILNIDHHPDNKLYGDVNLVDHKAAATCEIIYYKLKYLNIPITKQIATNLLAGIFFDTGGFRHASTTAATFEIAAALVRAGARIDRISNYFFGTTELAKLKAWARAFENARFDEKQRMVYSVVTEDELREIGAKPEHLEGVAEILNTVPEAKFSMFLKQRGDEIKGSLRSENYKGVDVSAIARTFGGGGHKLAAGFKLKGKIEKTDNGWKIT
ncbi:MAG: hypothetical protein COT91_05555 [Candidatus Doudnabacteria bacterium CG10_big_fil_rev_8_21_14_0_10_41_10]|uniref:Uncharacterized protein n=1 Tax=Candidatus Doudnabacteria bacterium CG10_big_fil_rev_8_21_14_0_10_41_10 TaxID=1974551 RepID=A0A2H0VC79_9BACT|nr:MAG: hypothetical protein COT91_05555 [Candidatus Doudnabacteria bacterium CG10_big_fil_rev_8_21_14_0_10_41_10]